MFKHYILIAVVGVVCMNSAYAENAVKYFYSNNTGEINVQSAYKGLTGPEQQMMQSTAIAILQINHVEQGIFENNVLGVYQMSGDHDVTADNTEVFNSSPYQNLSSTKVFSIHRK